jgi:hypothetical protein
MNKCKGLVSGERSNFRKRIVKESLDAARKQGSAQISAPQEPSL